MHKATFILNAMAIFFMLVFIGCSSGKGNPLYIDQSQQIPATPDLQNTQNHELLGIWNANIDTETLMASVEPNREAMAHFNVKPFLPTPQIVIKSWDPVNQVVGVDVKINNNTSFNAYDLRLIIYTDAVGHLLTNPDNWTGLFDISGGDTINPFKAYAKSNTNRAFYAHTMVTENLLIKLPGGNPSVSFAIDASYPENCKEPYKIANFTQGVLYDQVNKSTDVGVDIYRWNPSATIYAKLTCPALLADEVSLTIDSGDHYTAVLTNFNGAAPGNYVGLIKVATNAAPSLFLYQYVTITVTLGPDGWVQVNMGYNPKLDVTDSNTVICTRSLYVGEYNTGGDMLNSHDINSDAVWTEVDNIYYDSIEDFIYFMGIGGTCDSTMGTLGLVNARYDTGLYEDWHHYKCFFDTYSPSNVVGVDPSHNSYFCGEVDTSAWMWKFNSSGDEVWYHIINNEASETGALVVSGLAFQGSTTLLGAGYFRTSTGEYINLDYNGGPAGLLTSHGPVDSYIVGWDANGAVIWCYNWGDSTTNYDAVVNARGLAIDLTKATLHQIVMGDWTGSVDFDPSPTSSKILKTTSAGDLFIVKYTGSTYANTMAVKGTTQYDHIIGYGITVDPGHNIIITGWFRGSVDFDPGTGQAIRTAHGTSYDIFVAKYTKDFALVWADTFGDTGDDVGLDVATDSSSNIYVSGRFSGTVDFEPGSGESYYTSVGQGGFLLKLLSDGTWWE